MDFSDLLRGAQRKAEDFYDERRKGYLEHKKKMEGVEPIALESAPLAGPALRLLPLIPAIASRIPGSQYVTGPKFRKAFEDLYNKIELRDVVLKPHMRANKAWKELLQDRKEIRRVGNRYLGDGPIPKHLEKSWDKWLYNAQGKQWDAYNISKPLENKLITRPKSGWTKDPFNR